MKAEELNKFEKMMSELKDQAQIEEYVGHYCSGRAKEFNEYLNEAITRSNMKVSDVMRASGINANYGYNIVSGARKRPGRDKIIALCIGSGMSFEETQEALDAAGLSRLYYRSERDVRVAAALNNRIRDVFKVNMDLSEHDLEPLSV